MTDVFHPQKRSAIMQAIRSRHTSPEIAVRRIVSSLGVRYRLHAKNVPGNPDLVMPALKKAIFVHGCFWHRHRCRKGQSMPSTRFDFWTAKFAKNTARDRAVKRRLRREGWQALVVWECQLTPSRVERTAERLKKFLVSRKRKRRSGVKP